MFFLCGVVRLGEVLVRTSGIFLAVDISSVPLFLSRCPPFRPVGDFGGVLWRLGTIFWHIHGFSTDT